MKKTFSFTFLIIFLFNIVGYFLVFKVEQFQIKNEIKSKIKSGVETKFLSIITINKTNLASIEWLESGKEMRYNDQLYDVVKYTETENTITYYCINDLDEMSLFINLDAHINVNIATNDSQKSSKKISHHVVKLYFPNEQQWVVPASGYFNNYQSFNLIFSSTIILEKNNPPPEFV